jgi:Holliday junction resolvasome RuvABC endonuclease subunit
VRSLLLGIDVSPRRLGWGLVDLVTGDPVVCGWQNIDLPDHGWQHQQIAQALMAVPVPRGMCEIQAVYIEDTANAGKYRQHDAGRAQGIAQVEVERRWPWVTVQFLKPSEWKKLAGLKGNASKSEVWAHATIVLGEVDIGSLLTQDAADALLIAVAGQRRNDENWARAEDAA